MRIKKDAFSKRSGYVWTGPKKLVDEKKPKLDILVKIL